MHLYRGPRMEDPTPQFTACELHPASARVPLRVALSAGDPEELSTALEAAIRATLPGAAPISVDTADGEHVVHVGVPSLHVLAGLRGAVLSGEFDATLSQALNQALTLSTAEPAVGDAVTLRGLVKRPALNGSPRQARRTGLPGLCRSKGTRASCCRHS